MTVIQGEYTSFKHVKTRKVVVLEVEVPEENFEEVIQTLGMPVGGTSKPVAVALLDESKIDKQPKEEGNPKMVTRAVMLCEEGAFQKFAQDQGFGGSNKEAAKNMILHECEIQSRSELKTNIKAQNHFTNLVAGYNYWLNS